MIVINQWHESACNHESLKLHVFQAYKWSNMVYTNFHIGNGIEVYILHISGNADLPFAT